MLQVQVLGPRRLLPEVLEFLQAQGVVQLRDHPPRGLAGAANLLSVDAARASALRQVLARIDALLATLPPLAARGAPVPLPPATSAAFGDALSAAEAALHAVDERRAALLAERAGLARLGRLLAALAPLRADTPVPPRARAFGLALRRERGDALPLLEAEVARLTGGAGVVRATDAGDGELAVLLVVPTSRAAKVASLLFEHGVEEVKVPDRFAAASPARAVMMLQERERAIPAELERVDAERAQRAAGLRRALVAARRDAVTELSRLEAVGACGETGHAFVVWGWIPRDRVEPLRAAAGERFGSRIAIGAAPPSRAELDDVPVVLSNPRWLAPFQLLLALVPLPRYGSIDPTPWLAVFFPLFFGVMLGDAGFGLIAVAVSATALARGWGSARGRAIAVIALACGVSAGLFGVVFGEAFGTAGEHLGLRPLLLDRREALIPLFGLVLSLGLIHLAIGFVLGAWDAARERRWRESAARAARLGLLLSACCAAASALGAVPPGALRPALGGAAAFAACAVACEGPMALLEALLSLGNVLSYARLAALGLASVMLAEVANGMPAALPGGGGVALAIMLHAVNFTLGVVSPGIAALRLQVVEFFEKFYCEGGRPYRPFAFS